MIGIVDVEVQAANPQMPLHPMRAYLNSPSSIRVRNVPRKVGDWQITSVQLVAAYPDNTIKTADCKLIGSVWVGTIPGSSAIGTSEPGYTIFASGTDENGNSVSNYALGKGLVEILDTDGTITPSVDTAYVHLYDEQPDTPKDGDVWPDGDGGYLIWQDGEAHTLGGGSSVTVDAALSATSMNPVQNKVVTAAVNTRPTKAQIDEGWWSEWDFTHAPTLIADNPELKWSVEAGGWILYLDGVIQTSFAGSIDDIRVDLGLDGYAVRHRVAAPVPTKTSDLTNDSGFLTQHQLLAPVYSDWTVIPPTFEGSTLVCAKVESAGSQYYGYWSLFKSGDAHSVDNALALPSTNDDDVTHLDFTLSEPTTATRSVIGYTLGTQTAKPLQPQGNYQPTLTAAQLANIAAVPDKADAASLPYALVSVTVTNGVATLTDRAVNSVSLTADATLVFPSQTAGKARDFVVRLTLTETNGVVPSVTFPADVAYETEGGEWPDLTEAGTYIVRLTEVPTESQSETARFFLQCSSAVADATPPSAGGAA